MARRPKTEAIIEQARAILEEYQPIAMSLRQVHYQLVARQVAGYQNTQNAYKGLSRMLANARREGVIPWEWIEDRTRQARGGGHGFSGPTEYLETLWDSAAYGYHRDTWETQPHYVEVWVEKDALSGLFADAVRPYDLTLNVGKGFSSASEVYRVAQRLNAEAERTGHAPVMLYFGDFDPSGEDMVRDLRRRLRDDFCCEVDMAKCALTLAQVSQYNLPHDFTKAKDSRAKKHIERYGDIAVELDALRPEVLRQMIVSAVETVLDMDALRTIRATEQREQATLRANLQRAYSDLME